MALKSTISSTLVSQPIVITAITAEDLYNYLYWDYRIYDLRSSQDYAKCHIHTAHHIDPSTATTVSAIACLDAQITADYGRAEQAERVIICTDGTEDHSETLSLLQAYLNSPVNPSSTLLRNIHFLTGGHANFESKFPFLCNDFIHFNECIQLAWPSYIQPNLYLGSALCRNQTVVSMLGITHIMSFSDYPEKKLQFENATEWISNAIENDKGTVLVHCEQGVSRSPTIIIAYLLGYSKNDAKQFTTVNEALQRLRFISKLIMPSGIVYDYANARCST
ncbi:unnamed protein product [Didymodactylos carnosus]|uniref:protein-tyrosine-phosphatase n=1 Tax=Didymodactylos carnosus TaxID=1234261 RepID=A0A815CR85_9BILA|nr:unnamed protein product [Didymodactylos carnosus]CAF1287146.1 unnamed protein product [Didymodactylos carnosus]CAF3721208.1 unnamed protein product [Didymodactylos carnosus]CAF4089309.1 unnamed protein product [Didymodactylos carnosus]